MHMDIVSPALTVSHLLGSSRLHLQGITHCISIMRHPELYVGKTIESA